jgi:hypothetical protein
VRIGGENVYRRRENLDYTVPDGFAGSIPESRAGHGVRVPFPTRGSGRHDRRDDSRRQGEDAHRADAIERRPHAPRLPSDYQGQRIEPSFTSVLQAYYGAGLGDWSVVWERRAQPGDTILVHVGSTSPNGSTTSIR